MAGSAEMLFCYNVSPAPFKKALKSPESVTMCHFSSRSNLNVLFRVDFSPLGTVRA